MYAKGMSVRDIQGTLQELYGVDVSPTTLSAITDKVWSLVEEWQNRSLASIYPIVYLDAIHIKLRRESKVENIAVYTVLGVDVEGHRDILGHWVGEGSESSNFWLSVITDLQTRGVKDIFIACMDGLSGFKEAVLASFPRPRSSAASFTKHLHCTKRSAVQVFATVSSILPGPIARHSCST